MLDGHTVVDSTDVQLVWEHRYYPAYYLPVDAIDDTALVESPTTGHHDALGPSRHWHVQAGDAVRTDGAWQYPKAQPESLQTMIRFDWAAADTWLEEDEQVFVHPRNPYVRVDILPSRRDVRVEIDGQVVAEATQVMMLFETGLPVRYYLYKGDVRMDLLRSSDLLTECPYKGRARHWHAAIGDQERADVAWTYDTPLPESTGIRGMVSFYPERVTTIVDGEPLGS